MGVCGGEGGGGGRLAIEDGLVRHFLALACIANGIKTAKHDAF